MAINRPSKTYQAKISLKAGSDAEAKMKEAVLQAAAKNINTEGFKVLQKLVTRDDINQLMDNLKGI